MTSTGTQDEAGLVAATWLGERVLLIAVESAISAGTPARLAAVEWRGRLDDQAGGELTVRSFPCHPATDRHRVWLMSVGFDRPIRGGLPPLVLEHASIALHITKASLGSRLYDAQGFADNCGSSQDASSRLAAIGFLSASPEAHRLAYTVAICEDLRRMRDVLRPALPVSRVAPGVPLAVRVEQVMRLDERAFLIAGWLHAESPADVLLTVVSPEGARSSPRPGSVTLLKRPDVGRAFSDSGRATVGFLAYVETATPSLSENGWIVELRSGQTEAIEDALRNPVVSDLSTIRRALVQERLSRPDAATFANQIFPACRRVTSRPDGGTIEAITDFGRPPDSPDSSIIIATPAIDRVEHQLLALARDPSIADTELIFAIPRAQDAALDTMASELCSLHRLPFRIVRISPGASRSRALNLGASVAGGRLIVLMGGDVIPASHGWLDQLKGCHDREVGVGAVGPRLLFEDGSIAEAGFSYARRGGPGLWRRAAPLRGLSPTLDGAAHERQVQAVSIDCVLISADQFRAAGGLCELYLGQGEEDGDLCLWLGEQGLVNWYVPAAELYLLERDSWGAGTDVLPTEFNSWLLDHRWGSRLRAEEREPTDAVSRSADVTTATTGSVAPGTSARSGVGVEILEIARADLDHALVLDAAIAPADASLSPYEDTYSLALEGWVVPRDGEQITIQVSSDWTAQREVKVDAPRTDVAALYPDTAGAERSGFYLAMSCLGLPPDFELRIMAASDSGATSGLGIVRGHRRRLSSTYKPKLQPLLVTSLGRTGSTWVVTVLSRHPELIACLPFDFEPAMVSFWANMLVSLSEPMSFIQALMPRRYPGPWWLGDQRPIGPPNRVRDPRITSWLGRENVEILAGFAQNQVDNFYAEVARLSGQEGSCYFVEKSLPDAAARLIGELYPDGREIFLVRDPRDRICSVLAYNAKRGVDQFGREQVRSDQEWLGYLREEWKGMIASWRERRDRAHLLRYEDLILDPEVALASTFDYLEVGASKGAIRRMLREATDISPRSQAFHLTSTSVAASVGRWKQDLPADLRSACAEAFDDTLVEFGYEPTSDEGTVSELAGEHSAPMPS